MPRIWSFSNNKESERNIVLCDEGGRDLLHIIETEDGANLTIPGYARGGQSLVARGH